MIFFSKTRLLLCFVQTLHPKGLDMSHTKHTQFSVVSLKISRSLMYISSQQPSMPTHEEVDVLTVKRVTHSEQLRVSKQESYSQVQVASKFLQGPLTPLSSVALARKLFNEDDPRTVKRYDVSRFEREPEKNHVSKVADKSCTCNKKCSNHSEQINWGKNEH